MKNMRLILGSFTAFLFLGGIANAQDPGIRDTARIVSVNVNPGDHFGLVMNLWNDDSLSAATLGISWGTSDLFLDSISYVGTRTENTDFPSTKINNTAHLGLSGFATFFGDPMAPGDGKFATFWFTVSSTAADQIIEIDSAFVPPAGPFILVLTENTKTIFPEYVMGTVTIGNPSANTPPVLNSIGPKFVDEGQNLNFAVSATDPEGDSLIFTALNIPTNSSFVDNGDNTATFDFTPDFTQSGVYNVTFLVSDGEFGDTEIVAITVNDVNQSPSFTGNANNTSQTINEGDGLASLEATDPEGAALTYS
ncbi:MAG: cadherin-like domain-containing protein, partial [candidate division Zixibacteria bacterium]|nr:cadherin-like domain-containing protein [candidate division Zixibacteria bacterium]